MKEKLLGLALLLLSTSAFAQANCGGVHVGGGACLPPGDPRLGGSAAAPPAPIARWVDRWGAIAADGHGVFGIVSDMTSKQEAQESAIQECKKRGGGACVVDLAYYNQCAAVGANTKNSFTFSAPTLHEAEDLAVGRCERRTGEKCNVYYSGCSMPIRVQ